MSEVWQLTGSAPWCVQHRPNLPVQQMIQIQSAIPRSLSVGRGHPLASSRPCLTCRAQAGAYAAITHAGFGQTTAGPGTQPGAHAPTRVGLGQCAELDRYTGLRLPDSTSAQG